MEYNQVSQDSAISKIVDSLVILILGVAIGVVVSQVLLIEEVTTVTSTADTAILDSYPTSTPSNNVSQYNLPEGARLEEN